MSQIYLGDMIYGCSSCNSAPTMIAVPRGEIVSYVCRVCGMVSAAQLIADTLVEETIIARLSMADIAGSLIKEDFVRVLMAGYISSMKRNEGVYSIISDLIEGDIRESWSKAHITDQRSIVKALYFVKMRPCESDPLSAIEITPWSSEELGTDKEGKLDEIEQAIGGLFVKLFALTDVYISTSEMWWLNSNLPASELVRRREFLGSWGLPRLTQIWDSIFPSTAELRKFLEVQRHHFKLRQLDKDTEKT